MSGYAPAVVEIESHPEVEQIQDYCEELTGARSVPRVWINKTLIGGASDVEKLFRDGTL